MTKLRTLNDYRRITDATAVFPDGCGTLYCTTKLVGETGELFEKIGKRVRDRTRNFSNHALVNSKDADYPEFRDAVLKELGDICWYTIRILARSKRDEYLDMEIVALLGPDPRREIVAWMHQLFEGVSLVRGNTFFYAENGVIHDYAPLDTGEMNVQVGCDKILVAVAGIAERFQSNIEDVLIGNIAKLQSRKDRGVIGGSGDNR